ncbi:MAG: hypothetical protein AAF487_10585 [Bacteroidota bacterium]
MKIYLVFFFILLSYSVKAQVAPQSTNEDERKELSSDKNSESIGYSANNYQLFNSRRDALLQSGIPSNQLGTDQQLNALSQGHFMISNNNHAELMMTYWLGGKNTLVASNLLSAYNAEPNNSDAFDEMLEYANWTNNLTLETEVAQKIKESNKYAYGIYQYSRDLLNSVPSDAILITYGEVETICARVIQLTENLQPNVVIIREEWLEKYRYSSENLSVLGLQLSSDYYDSKSKWMALTAHKEHVFLSLTIPLEKLNPHLDHLYLTGLTFQYSNSKLSNLQTMKENWENLYNQRNFNKSEDDYYSKNLLSNYLISGIKVYSHYNANGEEKKAKALKDKLKKIAEKSGQKEKLKYWF